MNPIIFLSKVSKIAIITLREGNSFVITIPKNRIKIVYEFWIHGNEKEERRNFLNVEAAWFFIELSDDTVVLSNKTIEFEVIFNFLKYLIRAKRSEEEILELFEKLQFQEERVS